MKQFFFLLALFAAMTTVVRGERLQTLLSDTIVVKPFPGSGIGFNGHDGDDWGLGNKPHAPLRVSLPIILYEDGSIFFYPASSGFLSIRVEDAIGSIVCSDDLHLYTDGQNEYALPSLPAGYYRLIVIIAGREYEGEFEVD